MAHRYAPQINAIEEAKLEITAAHLWLEEIISGDQSLNIGIVWKHIDQGEWYAQALLHGGAGPEGQILTVRNIIVRRQAEKTLKGIIAFREIAKQRWENQTQSGIGTPNEQRFDQAFEDFQTSANDTSTLLLRDMNDNLRLFDVQFVILIVIILSLGFMTGVVLRRNVKALKDSEERFRALSDASYGGIVIHDRGVILECNQGLSDITGFSGQELVGMDGFNLITSDTLGIVLANVKRGYNQAMKLRGSVRMARNILLLSEERILPTRVKMFESLNFVIFLSRNWSKLRWQSPSKKPKHATMQSQHFLLP
ncbi:PAS domain S-box protein [Magnetovibrio blakemorei]|nr:PAS domain S-box protein [Magnetovibrio blakemorei]